MTDSSHIVILGGGVSGLSLAWRLLEEPDLGMPGGAPALAAIRRSLRVTVVESAARLGGNLRSARDRGFLIEHGPTGFLDNSPETLRLCHLLGLDDRVRPANASAAKRFLFVRGRLREAPLSPPSFLFSGVLSVPGRLRVLCEPFIGARPDPEESVFDFAARRIGPEAARNLVQAMISGVYAGDAKQLSVGSALPKIHALERDHGGLVRGMLAKMFSRGGTPPIVAPSGSPHSPAAPSSPPQAGVTRGGSAAGPAGPHAPAAPSSPLEAGVTRGGSAAGPAGPGGTLTSFDEGMEVLIHALASRLCATGRCEIRTGATPTSISPPGGQTEVCPTFVAQTSVCAAVGQTSAAGIVGQTSAGAIVGQTSAGAIVGQTSAGAIVGQTSAGAIVGQTSAGGIVGQTSVCPSLGAKWRVSIGGDPPLEADALISSIPAVHAAPLFQPLDPALAEALLSIPQAPIVVVALAYQRADLPAPLDGFGLLIPRGEGPRSLGVLWDSSIFPGRAPEPMALVRAMIGGAQDPTAVDLPDDELLRIARDDIRTTMGLSAAPAIHWIIRHPLGIPQYTIGHAARMRIIEERSAVHPGLYFTGNSYRGISVNLCIEDSLPAAREVLSYLAPLARRP